MILLQFVSCNTRADRDECKNGPISIYSIRNYQNQPTNFLEFYGIKN